MAQIFLQCSLLVSCGFENGAQLPPDRGGLQQTTPTPLSPWAPVFAEVHWPGRRAAPCVSHAGTRRKAPWPPGAAPGHSTQVYLKPPLASRLLTGHRPKQISRSCLSGVRSPLCPPRSRAGSCGGKKEPWTDSVTHRSSIACLFIRLSQRLGK